MQETTTKYQKQDNREATRAPSLAVGARPKAKVKSIEPAKKKDKIEGGEMCIYYHEKGWCKFGKKCRNVYSQPFLKRPASAVASSPVTPPWKRSSASAPKTHRRPSPLPDRSPSPGSSRGSGAFAAAQLHGEFLSAFMLKPQALQSVTKVGH